MKLATLGSGSSGNATWVEGEQGALLIDGGLSYRAIKDNIEALGLDLTKLRGVFLTHEHYDHYRGVPPLVHRLKIPVFATAGTFAALEGKFKDGTDFQVVQDGKAVSFYDLVIWPHGVIHDAQEPVCFSVSQGSQNIAVVTDLGTLDERIARLISRVDALVFEANYDASMLESSSYPKSLKLRISGPKGHLANDQAGQFLSKYLDQACQFVILAHLSENNNTPCKALQCLQKFLQSHLARGLSLALADRHEPFGIMDLKASNLASMETLDGYSPKIPQSKESA